MYIIHGMLMDNFILLSINLNHNQRNRLQIANIDTVISNTSHCSCHVDRNKFSLMSKKWVLHGTIGTLMFNELQNMNCCWLIHIYTVYVQINTFISRLM